MKTMKLLFGMMLMLMVSMTASAQEVVVVISDFTGGTVSVKEKKGQEVIINVVPADGYYINTEDMEVIAVRDPASLTRAGDEETQEQTLPAGVTLPLTLVDDDGKPIVDEKGEPVVDPDDNTAARCYLFTVPEGLGAWVRKAVFHEVDKPATSGKLTEKVSWEITSDETSTTLILSGDGEASLGASKGAVTYPWSAFDDAITDIIVEEGIEAIGDGILNNCTALKTVTLKGQKMVGLGKNELTDNVSVDVYGRLYNEYKAANGWSDAVITSSDGEKMTGVAFGEGNDYDVFYSEKAMLVPSVLLAFTVTAIDGSTVKIEEIKDGIIPAKVAVLLLSKEVNDNDFRTSLSDKEGTATSTILAAAGEGGKDVTLGEVYLLYNDVFYLSQAGTIPEGGVYLQIPKKESEPQKEQPSKTRSLLTIGTTSFNGDDGTTAIISHLSPLTPHLSDSWYDLNGRRLNGKPTVKGVYVNGGKKYIIK